MFTSKFIPKKNSSRLINQKDIHEARADFLNNRTNNLHYLLQKRYGWISSYIEGKDTVLEVGSGPGLISDYLKEKIILTDLVKYPWIDKEMSAEKLDFPDNSIDVIICSCVLHHLPHPILFLKEAERTLKPNGVLIVIDIKFSILAKMVMGFVKIEGWDYGVNVYDSTKSVIEGSDSMDANLAVPDLFFSDTKMFSQNLPKLKIESKKYFECFIFLISGGIRNKSKTIQLPFVVLKMVHILDKFLIYLMPQFFALSKKIVLRKQN
ncbi:MAG: class I SAM-dependent methyltransferase [Bacteriovoracaceae bacterium]